MFTGGVDLQEGLGFAPDIERIIIEAEQDREHSRSPSRSLSRPTSASNFR